MNIRGVIGVSMELMPDVIIRLGLVLNCWVWG